MKRSVLTLLLILFLLNVPTALAHKRTIHDRELEKVLFDRENPFLENEQDPRYRALHALENAVSLCLDQFGMKDGQATLEELRFYGIPKLPKRVEELNPPVGQTQLSASNHRAYTHRGWDYYYQIDLANWPKRKSILTLTAQKVFSFKDEKQCDSFSALLYYIHILGDYLEDSDYKKFNGASNGQKIPFASANYTSTPDIFSELEKHLSIVFHNQLDTNTYLSLKSKLTKTAKKARKITGSSGGVNNQQKYEEIHQCAEELMAVLCGNEYGEQRYDNRFHKLLANEDFFRKVFGP